MNVTSLFRAVDALIAFRDAAKRFRGNASPPLEPPGFPATAQAQGLAGAIEARLTNVVVAALKEAFDRDHARLELERGHLEEVFLRRTVRGGVVATRALHLHAEEGAGEDGGLLGHRDIILGGCREPGRAAVPSWPWAPLVLNAFWLLAGSYNFILTVALAPAGAWLLGEMGLRRDWRGAARFPPHGGG